MNLAELRKKAQKGKGQESGAPVAADERTYADETVLPEHPAPTDIPVPLEVGALGEASQALDGPEPGETEDIPDSRVFSHSAEVAEPLQVGRCVSPEESFPSVSPSGEPVVARAAGYPQVAVRFDPLSVLLAGREAAMTDEELFVDAGAAAETGEADYQEFLCFRVATEVYAINIMAIKEIIKPREVTEVPRAPEFVAGVLSLRGIIIPVFDMRLRLGLPVAAKSAKERIIVVKKGEEFFGIIVDEVIQVVRLATPTIEKPPAVLDGIDRDFVNGIGHFNGQMLIVLNQEKILDLTLV